MDLQKTEIKLLRQAHLHSGVPSALKPKKKHSAADFAAVTVLAAVYCLAVLLLERAAMNPGLFAALWAAPLAMTSRSLSRTIFVVLIVFAAYFGSTWWGVERPSGSVVVFLGTGVCFLGVAGIMAARTAAIRAKDLRDRDLFAAGYIALANAVEYSTDAVVWLDAENNWIYCNQQALMATGISRITLLSEVPGRAENEAMIGLMHSASREAWRKLVDLLNSRRAVDQEGPLDSVSPNSRLFGSIGEGNVICTKIKLADAMGLSSIRQLRATFFLDDHVLVHILPSETKNGPG